MTNKLLIGPFGAHYAKIVDKDGKYVSWASDTAIMRHLTISLLSLNRRGNTIDLQVEYSEKDKAKKLGAKWDSYKKVWFVELDNPHIDQILAQTNWITEFALEFCEKHKDTQPVHSSDEILRYLQFRVNQGWDYDMNWGSIHDALSHGFL